MNFHSTQDSEILKNFTKCGYIYKSSAIGDAHHLLLSCLHCNEVFCQLENFLEHSIKHLALGELYSETVEEDSLDIEGTIIKTEKNEFQSEILNSDALLEKQEDGNRKVILEGETNEFLDLLTDTIKTEHIEELERPANTDGNHVRENDNPFEDDNEGEYELSTMTKDCNINFNNMFRNSQNLTTLETVLNTSGSESQNVKPVQPVTLEGIMANFSKAIEPMFTRLTNEVTSLRLEIKDLANEVKDLKKEKSVKLVMPESPYRDMEHFLNFEQQLREDKKFLNSFGKELLSVAKTPNFIRNCWRKLLVDELAEKLCWKGTEEKKSVRSMSAAKAIRNAAISIGLGEDDYVKSTKSFFQFAKSRHECKKKYKTKSKIMNS